MAERPTKRKPKPKSAGPNPNKRDRSNGEPIESRLQRFRRPRMPQGVERVTRDHRFGGTLSEFTFGLLAEFGLRFLIIFPWSDRVGCNVFWNSAMSSGLTVRLRLAISIFAMRTWIRSKAQFTASVVQGFPALFRKSSPVGFAAINFAVTFIACSER